MYSIATIGKDLSNRMLKRHSGPGWLKPRRFLTGQIKLQASRSPQARLAEAAMLYLANGYWHIPYGPKQTTG